VIRKVSAVGISQAIEPDTRACPPSLNRTGMDWSIGLPWSVADENQNCDRFLYFVTVPNHCA